MNKRKRILATLWVAVALCLSISTTALAAADPLTVVNNLSDFMFSIIRAIGVILLGFGIVQIGMSLKSHDPSQRSNGFMTFFGGLLIMFAKEILTLITG
jgi:hydrogenase-4 membrane subunit HyfE